jgi:hypothetical protein
MTLRPAIQPRLAAACLAQLLETAAQEAKPIISRLRPLDEKYLVQYLRQSRVEQ